MSHVDTEKAHSTTGDSKSDIDQIENGGIQQRGVAQGLNDPSYVDHRDDDDRADEAKGRNSDKYGKSYWISVNYIGTMFAIGMAFMGGIGGESPCSPKVLTTTS